MLIGKRAVPFGLPDLSGKIHQLSSSEGRWLLLVFHRHLG
ncbi:peroxiredoxin family protein [Mariniblastus fucicola]|nr:peroxiredoxin family protein [Mariniblastus fucicola]